MQMQADINRYFQIVQTKHQRINSRFSVSDIQVFIEGVHRKAEEIFRDHADPTLNIQRFLRVLEALLKTMIETALHI